MLSYVFILFWISWTYLPSVYLRGSVCLSCLPNFLIDYLCSFCCGLRVLYIFWIPVLCWICDLQYCLSVCSLYFHSLNSVFHGEKFLILIKPIYQVVYFINYAYGVKSKNFLPNTRSWRLCFLLKVLWFYIYMSIKNAQVSSCPVDVQLFQCHFLKR